jgi:chromosome partitioning protein
VARQLEGHFGDKVFRTVVPRNVRLAEAPSHGLPGVVYDEQSKGAQAYLSFGEELLARLKEKAGANPPQPTESPR